MQALPTQRALVLQKQQAVRVVMVPGVVQPDAVPQVVPEAQTVQQPSAQEPLAPRLSARAPEQAVQLPPQIFPLRAAELHDDGLPAVPLVRSHQRLRSFPVLQAQAQLRQRDGDGVLRHQPERARVQAQAVRQPRYRGADGKGPRQAL